MNERIDTRLPIPIDAKPVVTGFGIFEMHCEQDRADNSSCAELVAVVAEEEQATALRHAAILERQRGEEARCRYRIEAVELAGVVTESDVLEGAIYHIPAHKRLAPTDKAVPRVALELTTVQYP